MKQFSVIFCCKCGSTLVDVCGWKDKRTATIRCCDCHQSATLRGFTLGRTDTEGSALQAVEEAEADKAAFDPGPVPEPGEKTSKTGGAKRTASDRKGRER